MDNTLRSGGFSYAGDVSPSEAWEALSSQKNAVLLDVRTIPEWSFVGVPDLSGISKKTALISWRIYPSMDINASFADQVKASGASKDSHIYIICRTGGRSKEAAIALTRAGFEVCYNIVDGFEGDVDSSKHRGVSNGWKAEGLPWEQN